MAQQTKRPAKIKGVTPLMTFKFPKLNEPDYGTKEFPKENGEYSLKTIGNVDDPGTKKLLAFLQPHFDEAISEGKRLFKELKVETRKKLGDITVNPLFTTMYDQETEEPTGEIEFKFAMTASGEVKKGPKAGTRWNQKPGIVDAQGNTLPKPPAIWGGTEGLVSFELSPYFIPGNGAVGLKLKLVGVQIVNLKTAGERSASSMGFGKVEGGFDGSTYQAEDDDDAGSGEDQDFGNGSDNSAADEQVEF